MLRHPLRAIFALGLAVAVLTSAGASAWAAGSWGFAGRIPPGTSVAAAAAGQLTLYLRNAHGTLLAGVDKNDAGQPAPALAAGQALIVWTQPSSDGQALVGLARSDVVAVNALFSDGSTALLPLDTFNAFSAVTSGAQLVDLEAVDSTGTTVGEITVAPTGDCAAPVCRLLTTGNADATPASTGAPLYGLFSTPRAGVVRMGKGGTLPANFGGGTTISRVNPTTLAPIGKQLKLPSFFSAQAFSPNGRYLLGSNQNTLRIIDLRDLSTNTRLETALANDLGWQDVHGVSWPTENRVLVIVQRLSQPYHRDVVSRALLGIDPLTGRIVWKQKLTNKLRVLSAQTVAGKLVIQLVDSNLRRTNETLVIASPDGRLRSTTIAIPRINSQLQEARLVTTGGPSPGADLVTANGTVFSIDLDSAQTTIHRVASPPGAPTGVPSPFSASPDAAGLGTNIVASGLFTRPNGEPRTGIYLIDTRTWTARLLDRRATRFVAGPKRLITYSAPGLNPADQASSAAGTGIAIYDLNGVRLYHLYGQRKFAEVGITPSFGFAFALTRTKQPLPVLPQTGERLVFDPTTGKSLHHNSGALLSSPRLISPGTPLNNND